MKAPKKKNFGFASLVDDEEDIPSEEEDEEAAAPTVQKTPSKERIFITRASIFSHIVLIKNSQEILWKEVKEEEE